MFTHSRCSIIGVRSMLKFNIGQIYKQIIVYKQGENLTREVELDYKSFISILQYKKLSMYVLTRFVWLIMSHTIESLSIPTCDAPTRWLDAASRSRSGHGRGGAADTCTTRCRRLLSGSDTARSETRVGGHLQLLGCAADTSRGRWFSVHALCSRPFHPFHALLFLMALYYFI